MKKINQILLYSIFFISLLIGVILYQIQTNTDQNLQCSIPLPEGFCGTPDLTENQKKGQEIFNMNCAACHKLNAKSTGPALRNIDSLTFIKFLTPNKSKINSTKIEEFGIDYHQIKFSKSLNKEELVNLYDYCKN